MIGLHPFKVLKDEHSTDQRLNQVIEQYKIKFDEGLVENLRLINEQKRF